MKKAIIAAVLSLFFIVGVTSCSNKVVKTTKTVKITMEKNDDGVKLVKADTTYALDTIPESEYVE